MTTNHHTAIATGAAANASTINSPLEELDAAITQFYGQPAFSVNKGGTDQTISTSTTTTVTWSTEDIDTDGDFASNRFTPSDAGIYFLISVLQLATAVDQERYLSRITKNGTEIHRTAFRASSTSGQTIICVAIVTANGSTDYFEAEVFFDNGADIDGTATRSYFQGFKAYGT